MKPYSLDLREKVLRAYDEHRGSQRALAALFGVSRAFVEKLVQRRRSTGQIAPRPTPIATEDRYGREGFTVTMMAVVAIAAGLQLAMWWGAR